MVQIVVIYNYILYYTILYYTILYYTILYYTILYYTILYCTALHYTTKVCITINYMMILLNNNERLVVIKDYMVLYNIKHPEIWQHR
jgi:hypothetical protein